MHQGVAAELQQLAAYTMEEVIAAADGPPLLVVLVLIEATDVVFAVDSIPAMRIDFDTVPLMANSVVAPRHSR